MNLNNYSYRVEMRVDEKREWTRSQTDNTCFRSECLTELHQRARAANVSVVKRRKRGDPSENHKFMLSKGLH